MYMFHTMNILCYLGSGDLLLESLLGYLKECSNLYFTSTLRPEDYTCYALRYSADKRCTCTVKAC